MDIIELLKFQPHRLSICVDVTTTTLSPTVPPPPPLMSRIHPLPALIIQAWLACFQDSMSIAGLIKIFRKHWTVPFLTVVVLEFLTPCSASVLRNFKCCLFVCFFPLRHCFWSLVLISDFSKSCQFPLSSVWALGQCKHDEFWQWGLLLQWRDSWFRLSWQARDKRPHPEKYGTRPSQLLPGPPLQPVLLRLLPRRTHLSQGPPVSGLPTCSNSHSYPSILHPDKVWFLHSCALWFRSLNAWSLF